MDNLNIPTIITIILFGILLTYGIIILNYRCDGYNCCEKDINDYSKSENIV